MAEAVTRIQDRSVALLPKAGDGGTSESMERVATLEAHMEHVREDVAEIKGSLSRIEDKLGDMQIGIAKQPTLEQVRNWSIAGLGIGLALFTATLAILAIAITVWGAHP